MKFDNLLRFCVEQKASDVHIQAGSIPMLRIGRQLRGVDGPPVGSEGFREFLSSIAPPELAEDLDAALRAGAVFVHEVPGLARLRFQLARHLGEPSATVRVIPAEIPTLEALNLPASLKDIALARKGLVLIAGEPGTGRTTTLAAMLELINAAVPCRMITLESPVEFRIIPKKAMVAQRSVGDDVPSYSAALARVPYEDADVVALGRADDGGAVADVLGLAEGGRQVFIVCEAPTSLQTIERVLANVPMSEQRSALRQLAVALEAVIALRMATTREGNRRPVVEILRGGTFTTRSLVDGRISDLQTQLTGRRGGMQSFDMHLVELYHQGVISGTEAMRQATNPETVAGGLRSGPAEEVGLAPG